MTANDLEENQMRQRILTVLHQEGMSQRQLALKMGRNPVNVCQALNGKRHFQRGFYSDLIKVLPQINKDWLLFGEGSMYGESVEAAPIDTRPRIPKSMSGGGLAEYYKGAKRELCQEKPIITRFSDYDFTLILKNNRMSPKYDRGDEVAFKHSEIVEWGNDYLLDTPEGPKFKKVLPGEGGVRCVSYNKEEYPEFFIPNDKILGFYRCVGVLRIF